MVHKSRLTHNQVGFGGAVDTPGPASAFKANPGKNDGQVMELSSLLSKPSLGIALLLAGLAALAGSLYLGLRQGMESGFKDPVRCLCCSRRS